MSAAAAAPDADPHVRRQHFSQASLKLSWLLRPLRINVPGDQVRPEPAPAVKMPTYLSSLTLCQTIIDPIEGGIVSQETSEALFQYFLLEMNAKWEYVLDPRVDTHDAVRRRSPLLLASVLFCASKFACLVDGAVCSKADPFLLCRLCSLARSLAINTITRGDRSVEAMQAFYLLVCWKDADDDISYLHGGYGTQILRDMDLEQMDGNAEQKARGMRAYMALFRQDKQQSLFFMRKSAFAAGGEDEYIVGMMKGWLETPGANRLDSIACCSADVRLIQAKLRAMARKSCRQMLPCLLDLADSEMTRWRTLWKDRLMGDSQQQQEQRQPALDPGKDHVRNLMGLWENSVKLSVASEVLRQHLTTSLKETATLDVHAIGDILTPGVPGLQASIESALETLRYFTSFPPRDLRRSPDSVLLLGPHAALFIVLILGLPSSHGVAGPSFQHLAVDAIRRTAQHVASAVESAQDIVSLHSAYLDSLVDLLPDPGALHLGRQETTEQRGSPQLSTEHVHGHGQRYWPQSSQAPAVGIDPMSSGIDAEGPFIPFGHQNMPDIEFQSLANLLEPSGFWEYGQLLDGGPKM